LLAEIHDFARLIRNMLRIGFGKRFGSACLGSNPACSASQLAEIANFSRFQAYLK
jgi:hypothetical protein